MVLVHQPISEGLSRGIVEGPAGEAFQLLLQRRDHGSGIGPGQLSMAESAAQITEVRSELLELVAEGHGAGHGDGGLGQFDLLEGLLASGCDMTPAGLAMGGVDRVIGGVGVGHQGAVEVIAQEFYGAVGRTIGDLIDGQVFVAREPDIAAPPTWPLP